MNQIQLDNLIKLRDDVFPVIFEMEKKGRVDLNHYESDCGALHCVLGWYVNMVYQMKFVGSRFFAHTLDEGVSEFGITCGDFCKLFGGEDHGTLEERRDYLCNIISAGKHLIIN